MKQIIVMRTDLRNTDGHKIRSGKLVAQGAHASLAAVLPYVKALGALNPRDIGAPGRDVAYERHLANVKWWLAGSFTKVCVQVGSEEELQEVYAHAVNAGLIAAYIEDNGLTEFGGVKTATCCAIGPDADENLAPITGGLKLL